jgi:geranylgeranyl transferase type-2 subunit alpha
MHGKKREEYKAHLRDPKTAAGLAHKAQQWHALSQELQTRRGTKDTNGADGADDAAERATTAALIEKALLVNPDPNYLWNFRRELLGKDESLRVLDKELTLTQAALTRNPKSYGAWFHRKWVIREECKGNSKGKSNNNNPTTLDNILQTELALTAKFLQLDERNFHCWNYRRFVVAAMAGASAKNKNAGGMVVDGSWDFLLDDANPMGPQLLTALAVADESSSSSSTSTTSNTATPDPSSAVFQELILSEFQFTTQKIQDNFSNFSAFHYRSQLLELMVSSASVMVNVGSSSSSHQSRPKKSELVETELQLVENAMCTEPDDQTAWWYHAFLLHWIADDNDNNDNVKEQYQSRLLEQADLLRELLEEAPGKWVLLGLHRLLEFLNEQPAERVQLLHQLVDIDPDRAQRYREMLLVLLHQEDACPAALSTPSERD